MKGSGPLLPVYLIFGMILLGKGIEQEMQESRNVDVQGTNGHFPQQLWLCSGHK